MSTELWTKGHKGPSYDSHKARQNNPVRLRTGKDLVVINTKSVLSAYLSQISMQTDKDVVTKAVTDQCDQGKCHGK